MCFLEEVFNYIWVSFKWKSYMKNKELSKKGLPEKKKTNYFSFFQTLKNSFYLFYERQKKKHRVLILKLTTTGTFENYVVTAFVGLVMGILVAFRHYFTGIYMGDASVLWGVVLKMPLLVVLTGFLAFRKWARCYIVLIPLHLFSKSGTMFIAGEMTNLVCIGPMPNILHNLKVIQESSTCQQRGVAAAAAEIADIIFGPFSSFKEAAKTITEGIKKMVSKMQEILIAFKRTVMTVADAIQGAAKWINSKINGCKNTVGTTYQHCMQAFGSMYNECKVSVPSVFVKMCSVTELASNLCSSVKPGEYLCDLVYFNFDPLVTTINQRINRLWDRAYTLLFFQVRVKHDYKMESNSKTIADELKAKIIGTFDELGFDPSDYLFHILSTIMDFYFLYDVYKYRSMFLKREEYDNYFIDDRLRLLDIKETRKRQLSIFPLRRIEKKKYVKLISLTLTNKEKKALSYDTMLLIKSVVVGLIMGVDYLVAFIVSKCRKFMIALMQTSASRTEIKIVGTGFIAELSRRVVKALNYMDQNFFYAHFMPCLPNPKEANSWISKKIFFFVVVLWISLFTRPYVLRLRHIVMDYFEPELADRRARWLYNRITFKRITFLTLIRLKLRSKYNEKEKNISIADTLRGKFPWITHIIGKGLLAEECMICEYIRPPLYRCPNRDCHGIYCDDCYVNTLGVCTLCKEEMMHSDFEGAHFDKVIVDKACDEEDREVAEGLFSVIDDDSEDLEFDYQDGVAYCRNTLQPQGETNVELETRYFITDSYQDYGNGKNLVETVFYPALDEEQLDGGNQPGFKYTRLHERPYTGESFSYENTFEWL